MLYILCNHGGCEIFLTGLDGVHPVSYAMGTGSFLRVKQPGVALTTHLYIMPRLKK
jgi:hypothetical protein